MKKTISTLILFTLILFGANASFGSTLLNGVAIHNELGKDQFVGGLYTSNLRTSARSILLSQETKKIEVRILANRFSSRRFKRMWIEGMAINSSPAELEKHSQHMAEFSNLLKIKLIRGDNFVIDRSKTETTVLLNGSELGKIASVDFFDLLLRSWIGPVPLSSDFRTSLLVEGVIPPDTLAIFERTKPSSERVETIRLALEERNNAAPKTAEGESGTSVPALASGAAVSANANNNAPASETEAKADDETAQATPAPTPKPVKKTPKPKPKKIALAPTEDILDESIFDDEDDEFTAESLLIQSLYISKLARWTHKFTRYPKSALNRRREGSVRLRVTVDRKGEVKNVDILEPAKYKAMNKEAKNAVKRADPYPSMPDEVSGEDFSFTFKMTFKLPKS